MLKSILMLPVVAILSVPVLMAQQPTWAESLFKIKMGRPHPSYEARVKEQKKTHEKASLERFSKLDQNKDGVISGGEWQSSVIPPALDADGDGAISIKEWTATNL